MTTEVNTLPVNREYKSRLFAMIFHHKKELLELYNAMNGSNYDDPELLEINTLKNAIYMAMQNDVSFIIDYRLSLYEHQSTYCPNMPLRFLHYISDLFSDITRNMNVYGTKLISIPAPQFVIFYNGTDKQPDRKILKLSDAYVTTEDEPALELIAVMLNINKGHNRELLEACKTLRDYAEYIARVRDYAKTMEIEDAVECAIAECIKEGILAEFLMKNRSEAKSVSIYEYDQEKHMRMEREDAWADGHKEGTEKKLVEQIQKKLKKGKEIVQIADELEEEESTILQLMQKYNLEK